MQDKVFPGSRGQRRPYESIWEGEWVWEDQEAGEEVGGGLRQREQKCEKLRGHGKPGTGGAGGTEEVARSWATRSELEETELKVLTHRAAGQSCIP